MLTKRVCICLICLPKEQKNCEEKDSARSALRVLCFQQLKQFLVLASVQKSFD